MFTDKTADNLNTKIKTTKTDSFSSQIASDCELGFNLLNDVGPVVAIYGSSRLGADNPYYQMTQELAYQLSEKGFAVMSGGGPGIMEAANLGAYKGQSSSIGVHVQLPSEKHPNEHLDISMQFQSYFPRKVMFAHSATAVIAMPGGFGTLDEVFEILTMVQQSKASPIPVIFVGRDFWSGLLEWIGDKLLSLKVITQSELELIQLVDSLDEVLDKIGCVEPELK